MATRNEKILVGAFTVLAMALLVGGTLWLLRLSTGEDKIYYFVEFSESVAGLRRGAPQVAVHSDRVGPSP